MSIRVNSKELKKFYNSEELEKLTIAEAVELLRHEGYNVTSNKLRQYEKRGLLSPEKTQAKYRLYSDSDLKLIREILALISLDFSIKEIISFFNLGGKVDEIIRNLTEINDKITDNLKITQKLEKSQNTPGEELCKFDQQHIELISRKWSAIETNKNLLIISKFLDFYNRILDTIQKRKKMLGVLEMGFFKQSAKDFYEEVFEAIERGASRKPV